MKKLYKIAVTLPLTLWVETEADNEAEATEKAKSVTLETPFEDFGCDVSTAEYDIVETEDIPMSGDIDNKENCPNTQKI